MSVEGRDSKLQILAVPILSSLRNLHCSRSGLRFREPTEPVQNNRSAIKLAKYDISELTKMTFRTPLKMVEESYAALLNCRPSTEDDYSDPIWSRTCSGLRKCGRGSAGGKVYKLAHDCKFFVERSVIHRSTDQSCKLSPTGTSTSISSIDDDNHRLIVKTTTIASTAEEFKKLIAPPLAKYLIFPPKDFVKEDVKGVDETELESDSLLILHLEFSCRVINNHDDKLLRTPVVFITSATVVID